MRYLGSISAAGTASTNNTTTAAAPFLIPPACPRLRLLATDAGMYAAVVLVAATLASPSSLTTNSTGGYPLVQNVPLDVPLSPLSPAVVAIFNSNQGQAKSVKVYALLG